jgi:hypothetical protein
MRALCLVSLAFIVGCSELTPLPSDPGPPHPIIEHVTQQEILTPLPLRVRLPAKYGVAYVLALVRTWGSRDWEIVELDRTSQMWSGEVSCRQVSTVTGPTRYFFLALDSHGEAVLDSGSPEWPYVATVVGSLEGGARGLPGQLPPLRCHDPADCPPDFPGCPAYQVVRGSCESHDDCKSAMCEWDGYCAPQSLEQDAELGVWDDDAQLAHAIRAATRRYRSAKRDSNVSTQ